MQWLPTERPSGLNALTSPHRDTPRSRPAEAEQPSTGCSCRVLDRTLSERENEEGSLRVGLEGVDLCVLTTEEAKDGLCPGIANRQPDDLSRTTVEETELSEVIVLGEDRITLLPGSLPNHVVRNPGSASCATFATTGRRPAFPP